MLCTWSEEDLLGYGYAEINQNILTNILAGFQFAWLFGALSDSRMMSFRTDVKLTSLSYMHSEKGARPLGLHGWFLGEGRTKCSEAEHLWVLHELDSHARAHCIVCVCC